MIKVIQADITKLEVEAIVNAANNSLLGGAGVDGATHFAAGKELYEYNKKLGGCDTGDAKLTPGFKLAAKWIIHTVGPVWQGGMSNEPELLGQCYKRTFDVAFSNKIRTLAFPAISTGAYGYPKEAAATIATRHMREHESMFEVIIACCFNEVDAELYERLLSSNS